MSRCARHLAENTKENCPGVMNSESKRLIVELAKSRTETVYQDQLQEIAKINDKWAKYLDEMQQCHF